MKAKYIVTLLLVGMFAIGVPVGAFADNGDGPVTDAFGEIEGPLGAGAVISQDNPSEQSWNVDRNMDESSPYETGEFDDGGA
jgi:hypothetical protein